MPPSKTAERLRRLLTVVPYSIRHAGTPLADLARLFEASEAELLEDLNLLFLTGLPPYGPGDLIEVEVDDEGRVWIRMADYLAQPARLTRTEALALALRGMELLGSGGIEEADALRSALDKLRAALGEGLEALEAEAGAGDLGSLAEVRRAAADRTRVEIEYYSATRDEVTRRRIDPEHVFSAIGNWYVVAWDHHADAERLFRVDRIRDIRATDERFEPRGLAGPGRELYTGSEDDIPVRLALGPGARWVAEYYVVSDQLERDGRLEVTLPTKDLAWVAKLVLRLGGEAEVLEPEELRARTRELADRVLEAYR